MYKVLLWFLVNFHEQSVLLKFLQSCSLSAHQRIQHHRKNQKCCILVTNIKLHGKHTQSVFHLSCRCFVISTWKVLKGEFCVRLKMSVKQCILNTIILFSRIHIHLLWFISVSGISSHCSPKYTFIYCRSLVWVEYHHAALQNTHSFIMVH